MGKRFFGRGEGKSGSIEVRRSSSVRCIASYGDPETALFILASGICTTSPHHSIDILKYYPRPRTSYYPPFSLVSASRDVDA